VFEADVVESQTGHLVHPASAIGAGELRAKPKEIEKVKLVLKTKVK